MKPYKHKKISVWRIASIIIQGIAGAIRLWPLALVLAIFISPISPHLRWEYTYKDFGSRRVYYHCTYLGVHGLRFYMQGDECPVVALLRRH